MNIVTLRRLVYLLLLSAWVGVGVAAEPPIIAKARAYIADEVSLDGLRSLQLSGSMLTDDPAKPGKQVKVALEISFQAPFQQRIVVINDKTIETTALDGYDGWSRLEDVKNPGRGRISILPVERIKRLRANTWENLSYFRGIERVGGRVEAHGSVVIDGVTCEKLTFIHAPNVLFVRYFDVATGRLVLTETESGDTIREEGEMVVNGIRFPRSLVTTSKGDKGQVRKVVIAFDKVIINQPIPARQFAVPGYGSR